MAELQEQWDAQPPPFVPATRRPPQVEEVPRVLAESRLRTTSAERVGLYLDTLHAGDPAKVALRLKELEDAEDEDDNFGLTANGELFIDYNWLEERERAYDVATAKERAGMSESDIAREGYKGHLPPAPKPKGQPKKKLFPKPAGAELKALRKKK